jgi:hypothetical protein
MTLATNGDKTERLAVSAVIDGLAVTSDKIRALARAGYLRTEISTFLNIRYQHVRKVLNDAGISDGLQRKADFERPPVSIETDLRPRVPTPAHVLLRAGFHQLGQRVALEEGEFELSAKAPAESGVYAFVVDDAVVYVGLAQRGVRTRMGHYRQGHKRQKTSARIKLLIAKTLASGKQVSVLVAVPKDVLTWNGLPINVAAGLEAGLIRMIQPEWNLMGLGVSNRSNVASCVPLEGSNLI